MSELDEICQDIKELFVNSNGEQNNNAYGFDKLVELSHHSKSTVSPHLKDHLLKLGYMSRDLDRKYRWNSLQQLTYPPTIIHTLYRFETTIHPEISHSETTLEFYNNSEIQLSSYLWYFTSPKPVQWNKIDPKIILKYDGKTHKLNIKENVHFILENPYHYKFRIDFPIDLPKKKTAELVFETNRFYEKNRGFIALFPKASTEKLEFVLNCPTSRYELRVRKINQETGKTSEAPPAPEKDKNKITWSSLSHNLENYYHFEWKKI